MKALTLIQPWATAIAHWGKDVENRSWAPPAGLLGQRIAIHAGKKLDLEAMHGLVLAGLAPDVESVPTGAVLATAVVDAFFRVDAEGKVSAYTAAQPAGYAGAIATPFVSRWVMPSGFGWVLVGRRALREPVPCRGAQGLWNVPVDVLAQMRRVGEEPSR